MSPRELAEDIAYVRTIAEEGRQAPLLGGSFLTFWGVLNAVAWTIQWSLEREILVADPTWHYAVLWAGFGLTAWLGSMLLGARVKDMPGRSSVGNRVESAAWAGASLGLGATSIGGVGAMILTRDTSAVDVIAPAAFALFGAALMITGTVSKERWLSYFAAFAYVMSVVLWLFLKAEWFYLAAAAGSIVALLTPGLILLRKEPSTTV